MENNNLSPRVINEVYQIVEMLPDEEKKQIPQIILDYLKNNATKIEEYKVEKDIPIDKQNLDDNTYNYVYVLMNYIKPRVKYEEIKPSWNELDDIKDKVKQLEIEIETNFFNVNNSLADRKLTNIEFVLNFYYFGLISDENKQKKLAPFIALCKVFIIVHDNLQKDSDYEKAFNQYKYISEQLKLNIENTF